MSKPDVCLPHTGAAHSDRMRNDNSEIICSQHSGFFSSSRNSAQRKSATENNHRQPPAACDRSLFLTRCHFSLTRLVPLIGPDLVGVPTVRTTAGWSLFLRRWLMLSTNPSVWEVSEWQQLWRIGDEITSREGRWIQGRDSFCIWETFEQQVFQLEEKIEANSFTSFSVSELSVLTLPTWKMDINSLHPALKQPLWTSFVCYSAICIDENCFFQVNILTNCWSCQ